MIDGKVSVSFLPHVYSLAKKRYKLTHNNFSAYINELVRNQFTDEELRTEQFEINRPLRTGAFKVAGFNSQCQYCKKNIIGGTTTIYHTDLGFVDDWKNWVHEDCCKEE